MKRYVALLRGVNVSGKNKLPMAQLRDAIGKTNFNSVTTYIQSGNLIFSSDLEPKESEKIITDILKSNFDLEVPVIVKEQSVISDVLLANPFKVRTTENPKFMSFGFLKEIPYKENVKSITDFSTDIETFQIIDDVIYFYCGVGFGSTKLTNVWFEKKLGVISTTRNYNTTLKLTQL